MLSFKSKQTKICHTLGPGFLSTSFDKRRSKAESTAMRISLSQFEFTRQVMTRFLCDHLSFAQDCLLGKSDWTDLCNVSDKVESFEMKDLTCMVFLRVLVLPHFCLQYVQVCGLSKLNQLFNMSEPTCLSYNKSMVHKICNQNSIQPIV